MVLLCCCLLMVSLLCYWFQGLRRRGGSGVLVFVSMWRSDMSTSRLTAIPACLDTIEDVFFAVLGFSTFDIHYKQSSQIAV